MYYVTFHKIPHLTITSKAKGKMAAMMGIQQLVLQVHIYTIPVPKFMHMHNLDTPVHWAMQWATCSKQCTSWRTSTYTWAYTSTVHTAPANHKNASGTSSTRETTNVITTRDDKRDYARDDECDHCSSSPQATTNVITTSNDVPDYHKRWQKLSMFKFHHERGQTWSPRETTYMTTTRDGKRDHGVHRVVLRREVTYQKP